MEVYGLIPKTRTVYKVPKEIHEAINHCLLNRNELELYKYKHYRIIQNEPPGMASVQYAYTIYDTLEKQFLLVVDKPFEKTYDEEMAEFNEFNKNVIYFNKNFGYGKPKVYDLKHKELLSNEPVFNKIYSLLSIKNPFSDIGLNKLQLTIGEIQNKALSLRGLFVSDETIRKFKGKYYGTSYESFEDSLNDRNKIEVNRVTTEPYFVMEDDELNQYRVGRFEIEGPLFIYNKNSKKIEIVNCSWLKKDMDVVKDISNIYLICVANILENSEKMELYQKKYSLYKKAKELTQKYAQKIHGVF